MFEDRVEIQSPGSLPNSLTIESMTAQQATRNEALTSILGRMPATEAQGALDRRRIVWTDLSISQMIEEGRRY